MDYTFYSEVLLHDAHSKHIRIILAIINGILESYKNGFLNLNEMNTEHATENPTVWW